MNCADFVNKIDFVKPTVDEKYSVFVKSNESEKSADSVNEVDLVNCVELEKKNDLLNSVDCKKNADELNCSDFCQFITFIETIRFYRLHR